MIFLFKNSLENSEGWSYFNRRENKLKKDTQIIQKDAPSGRLHPKGEYQKVASYEVSHS